MVPPVRAGPDCIQIEVSRQPGSMFSNCTHQMAPPQDGGLHEFYPGNYTQKVG